MTIVMSEIIVFFTVTPQKCVEIPQVKRLIEEIS